MAKHFALVLEDEVMNVYVASNRATPESVSAVNASRLLECSADVQPGWKSDGASFVPPTLAPRRIVSSLEFMDRVPKDARAKLRKFAAGDSELAKKSAPESIDEAADFFDRLRVAQDVRLDGEDLRAALALMVDVGLLTKDEADALVV